MVPIECGEAIEGVDLQAAVIAALQLESGHRVLEVGTGSGFTAAVMARLAARVITVDRYRTLVEQAKPAVRGARHHQRVRPAGGWFERAAGGGAVRPNRGLGGIRQPAARISSTNCPRPAS